MAVNGKRKQEHEGNKEKDYSFPNDGKNSQKANSFGVNRKKKKPTHSPSVHKAVSEKHTEIGIAG